MSQEFPRLLGDVGGTNARFAWQPHANAQIEHVEVLPGQNFPTILDAIQHYLKTHQLPQPAACCIGIANPIHGDIVRMTNHTWAFSISELQRHLGLQRLLVINDFTALALALPVLGPQDTVQVSGTLAKPGAIALLGAGTGLGVSGLLPTSTGGWVPVQGEGGHVTLAACDAREQGVIDRLRLRYDHVSAERVLSGPGLVNIYTSLCELDGVEAQDQRSAAQISDSAVSHGLAAADSAGDVHDRLSAEAVDIFCRFLGTVAGNLALTLGAVGGVYIGGGIMPRWGRLFEQSRFRERFHGKGRFISYLDPIPVHVITATSSPALLGAAQALDA